MEEGLNHVEGQPSLCYWPLHMTVKMLCDDVKKARTQQNLQLQVPQELESKHQGYKMQAFMFDFKTKKLMFEVTHAPLSNVIFDLRTVQ